jgi:hypothetical protein
LAVKFLLGIGGGVVRELKNPMNPPATSEFGLNEKNKKKELFFLPVSPAASN